MFFTEQIQKKDFQPGTLYPLDGPFYDQGWLYISHNPDSPDNSNKVHQKITAIHLGLPTINKPLFLLLGADHDQN